MVSISYPTSFLATNGTLRKVMFFLLEVPSFWDEGTTTEGIGRLHGQVWRASPEGFLPGDEWVSVTHSPEDWPLSVSGSVKGKMSLEM